MRNKGKITNVGDIGAVLKIRTETLTELSQITAGVNMETMVQKGFKQEMLDNLFEGRYTYALLYSDITKSELLCNISASIVKPTSTTSTNTKTVWFTCVNGLKVTMLYNVATQLWKVTIVLA